MHRCDIYELEFNERAMVSEAFQSFPRTAGNIADLVAMFFLFFLSTFSILFHFIFIFWKLECIQIAPLAAGMVVMPQRAEPMYGWHRVSFVVLEMLGNRHMM